MARSTSGAARGPSTAAKKATGERKGKAPLDGRRSRDREVIETAIQLFSEKGYASTSVQDVADALGMLKGSLYYYIDTKESLLRKIFEDSHAEVKEIADRHAADEGPALDRLSAFLDEYAMWYLQHLQRASLFAREWRHASEELRPVMAAQRKSSDDALRSLITEAVKEGAVDEEVDVRLVTYFILSAVSSLPDWFNPRGKRAAKQVAQDYRRMAIKLLVP